MDFPWNLIEDFRWNRFLSMLSAFEDAGPGVQIIGVHKPPVANSVVTVKYRATLATQRICVQYRTFDADTGTVYDPKSECRVRDLTDSRYMSETFHRVEGNAYMIWFVPVVLDGLGQEIRYDGEAAEDRMAVLTLTPDG